MNRNKGIGPVLKPLLSVVAALAALPASVAAAVASSPPPAPDAATAHDAAPDGIADIPGPLATRLLHSFIFFNGGSGVLIGNDGRILTCNHVIAHLDRYRVRLAGGATITAKLLGTDPVGDIALLQINPSDLPQPPVGVDFAAPATLHPGLPVVAVGNPFSLGDLDDQPTLSRGVLGSGRVVRGDYSDAIQADAPVNPGNSGGPLFAYDGTLLGINGQIRSRSGFRINSGIGLAISAPQLQAFLPALAAADGGCVHHTAAPTGLKLASGPDGVTVVTGAAGLLPGDLLIAINGRAVTSVPTALGIFAASPWAPGMTLPVTLSRGGMPMDLPVAVSRTPIPGQPYHGIDFDERGGATIVAGIDGGSPGASAGLHHGEVVVKANGQAITTRITLLRAMLGLEAGDTLTLDLRDAAGATRTVTVRLIQNQ